MPELLAPVRDRVGLTATLQAGADAVYLGLDGLNMRQNSPGIVQTELPEVVRQAHDHGALAYVTLNTLVYDDDLEQLEILLDVAEHAAVDAIICWDPVVIQQCRARGLAIHISTQAGIANVAAARFYEQLGASRVVLARELNLEQIAHIKQNTNLEIETFVHGAMCVSVSGRCFLSQYLYGRSGNRGDCLQPCRRDFLLTDAETGDQLTVTPHALLSPKDLCTLGILDRLVAAGIDVFKIEGRSRAPEYGRAVVAAYRQALDAIAAGSYTPELADKLIADVQRVFNRGFSTGFYLGRPGAEAWSPSQGNQAQFRKSYVGDILNYYSKRQVGYASIVAQPLYVGDRIQIHGPTTGVEEFEIEELRGEDGDKIDYIERGRVTFPTPIVLRRSDKIYKIESQAK